MKFICTTADKFFTEGRIYDVVQEEDNCVIDNQGDLHEIALGHRDVWEAAGDCSKFELVEQQQPETLTASHVHIEGAQDKTETPQESADCPVAIAYHIHELQKWLKHIGCYPEAELRISSEYVLANPYSPNDFRGTYQAKEGGVGTLIEYMRHIGGANKCLEKMEDVGYRV